MIGFWTQKFVRSCFGPNEKVWLEKKNVSKDRLLKIHFPVPGELDESWKNLLAKKLENLGLSSFL